MTPTVIQHSKRGMEYSAFMLRNDVFHVLNLRNFANFEGLINPVGSVRKTGVSKQVYISREEVSFIRASATLMLRF